MLGFAFNAQANEIAVVDGDSIWWRKGGWGPNQDQSDGATKYRLAGYDAPETRRHKKTSDGEIEWGQLAKQKLHEAIAGAKSIRIKPVIFGRWRTRHGDRVAQLFLDGRDVRDIAVEWGWGAAWQGKPGEKRPDWAKLDD
jgi:endonuclease YncB( thermonuclease family)